MSVRLASGLVGTCAILTSLPLGCSTNAEDGSSRRMPEAVDGDAVPTSASLAEGNPSDGQGTDVGAPSDEATTPVSPLSAIHRT